MPSVSCTSFCLSQLVVDMNNVTGCGKFCKPCLFIAKHLAWYRLPDILERPMELSNLVEWSVGTCSFIKFLWASGVCQMVAMKTANKELKQTYKTMKIEDVEVGSPCQLQLWSASVTLRP